MALSLSRRAEHIAQAEIRAMSIECEKAGGINLAQGVCDMEVPVEVRRAAQKAIDDGMNSYTRYDGIAELRRAIARKLGEFNQIKANPETEITVSGGSTGAFYCACLALLNPGDEVILFEPYYGYHVNTLLAVDAVPTYVTMRPPDWTFDPKDLSRAITPKTRAIMVNTPGNPSGKVFSKEEFDVIADLALKHDLFVFTDEIYEFFTYEGARHISPAAMPTISDRTITISGYSKTFSITGWRIGYSHAHERWAAMIGYINDLVYVCAPAPLQAGVAAGIVDLPASYYQGLARDHQRKRDKLCSVLNDIGLPAYVPAGAYYVLADVSRLPGSTSKAKAMHLLQKTGVASVPGESFFHGSEGDTLVRFCFAKTDHDLNEACQRLLQLGTERQAAACESRR
jgi:aminotransferase